MRIISVLLVSASLALALPVQAMDKGARPAATPTAQPAPPSSPETQLVTDLVQYGAAYQSVLSDASLYFSDFMDGAARNLNAKPIDKAKADAWIAQSRARLDVLKARRAALGPPSASLVTRLKAAGMASDVDSTRALGEQMGAAIDAVLDLCTKVLDLAPAVAQGDGAALTEMGKALQRGTRTALLTENAMMQGGLATLDRGHPQGAILRSILASNSALMALLDIGVKMQDDPKADLAPLIKQFQDSVAKARTEALTAGPLASRAIAQIKAEPGDEALKARVIAAMGTYAESGEVEVQIADILVALTQTDDAAKAASLNEELRSLVQRRLKLQGDRQAILAG